MVSRSPGGWELWRRPGLVHSPGEIGPTGPEQGAARDGRTTLSFRWPRPRKKTGLLAPLQTRFLLDPILEAWSTAGTYRVSPRTMKGR